MPELPDIELYRTRLEERLVGHSLETLTFHNPFVLRSFEPSPASLVGRHVLGVERMGKRLILSFEEDFFVVIHLMISGRLQWQSPSPPAKRMTGKMQLATFRFDNGTLSLIESSTKKRASIHLALGRDALEIHRRSGVSVVEGEWATFSQALVATNRTLKRALTDPATFDGIGNAYSDEILFAAKLSPVRTTRSLSETEIARLHLAARQVLTEWKTRLLEMFPQFPRPADVTAFRPEFAVHGRFGMPCPVCGSPVQRIVFAENETNYCAKCQNEGRLLADRSLSRLLKDDWPKTLEEMLGS